MVNSAKLKAKIIETGKNVPLLATAMGISASTLYRKINNGDTFLIREADVIINELSLTKDEVNSIFFAQIVA